MAYVVQGDAGCVKEWYLEDAIDEIETLFRYPFITRMSSGSERIPSLTRMTMALDGAVLAALTACNVARLVLHWIWAFAADQALKWLHTGHTLPTLNKMITPPKVARMKPIPVFPWSICGDVTGMCQRTWKAGCVEIRNPKTTRLATRYFPTIVYPRPIILHAQLTAEKKVRGMIFVNS